jgi:hypothetical protein
MVALSMSSATARLWLKRWLGPAVRQQLPVAVVGGGHRAGAHDALELVAGQPRHLGHRLLQRHLHLGQRRDRHPQRQLLVEHVVLAHIAVRQHVVAQRCVLRRPAQWPSISQACGRSTAMWSVMVLALAGPTPMLTMVMPVVGRFRW